VSEQGAISKEKFVFTFPFGVKIDTIKMHVFFNLQRKVAWREEDGDLLKSMQNKKAA